ncbi:hypothetical protein AVDCRST_MAG84-2830 [uncultured Microcoleus sp.]|uniref:Uncharacterized protein n=1 Tax=uncultured Microcoleus sp. TaxID=259945 RepID=A0A6J4M5E7_9CYAN|nr:hypothetical protein AVDCRST_MAG84-2830 [uncultured Microcoleus sp.]
MAVAKLLFRLVNVCSRQNKENFIPAWNDPRMEFSRQKILSDPFCL